jgi:predicted esterase
MHIIFSHGKESGPKGKKIIRLTEIATENGFTSTSIDYSGINNPDERVEKLLNTLKQTQHDRIVLVGSSMGGYVSLCAAQHIELSGIFLMAPALYLPGYGIQRFQPKCRKITIVHGWRDDIIPFMNSVHFANKNNCTLHLVNDNHRLTESLETIADFFEIFLKKIFQ